MFLDKERLGLGVIGCDAAAGYELFPCYHRLEGCARLRLSSPHPAACLGLKIARFPAKKKYQCDVAARRRCRSLQRCISALLPEGLRDALLHRHGAQRERLGRILSLAQPLRHQYVFLLSFLSFQYCTVTSVSKK